MKTIGLGLVYLSILASSEAQAACSTASLAGKWTSMGQSEVCVINVLANGNFSGTCSDSTTTSGNIALSANCRVSGTADGIAFKGRTDPIRTTSAAVPTLVIAASTNGKIAFAGFRQ